MADVPDNHPDLLYGLDAIGSYLGITARQAEHLIARGDLPSFKMGDRVCALRSAIAEQLAEKIAAGRSV